MSKMTDLEWFEVEKYVTPPIVRKLKAMQAQLAACQWVPITRKGPFPDNEQLVLAQTTEPLYRVMRFSSHLRKLYSDEGIEVTVRDISAWMPINPPQQGAK